MKKNSIIQHVIALLIFILISCAYALPALRGDKLSAGDTTHWMGMSHEAKTWYEKTGENPLWSNSMFGGMPTATYATHGHDNLIWEIQLFIMDTIPNPIHIFLVAMICFYVFAMSWRMNKYVAIIGAIAYAFASYNLQIIVAGHVTKMFSIAYMPLVLAGMQWIYQKKYLLGSGILLLGMSLTFSNAMYQMVYYLLFVLLAFGLGYGILAYKENKIKDYVLGAILTIVLMGISLGPSLSTFLFTKEYSTYTMRGGKSEMTLGKDKKTNGGLDKDYAFQWSQSIGETFTLLVPNLYGGGNRTDVGSGSKTYEAVSALAGEQTAENFSKNANTYWGPQPFLSGPVYFGAIIIFLFVLSMFTIRNPMKWFLLGVGLFGIMLSWGKHFSAINYFLFDHLPMFNNFRTPSMAMTIPGFVFVVLAIWGLSEIIQEKVNRDDVLAALKKSLIITGGLCLILGVGSSMFMSFKGENDDKLKSQLVQMVGNNEQAGTNIFNAIIEDRPALAMKDGLRSLVFILLAGALIWFWAKRKINTTISLAALGILVAVDVLGIGTRYLLDENYMSKDDFEAQFNPRPVDTQIKQDNDPYYRVLDLTTDPFNDAMGAYHHKLVGGYHPAKMEMYQDLIDIHLSGGKFNTQVLNMLNTKYFIYNAGNQPMVQQNTEACGHAWFVPKVQVVPDANTEITAMKAENLGDTTMVNNAFRPKEVAIVQAKYWQNKPTTFVKDSLSRITLKEYGLNKLSYESLHTQTGLAVFADIFYDKGWKAYVDGKESEIIKVNYLLRGLIIPEGKHKIVFEFKPTTYLQWGKVSLAASILILLLLVGGIGLGIKDSIKETA